MDLTTPLSRTHDDVAIVLGRLWAEESRRDAGRGLRQAISQMAEHWKVSPDEILRALARGQQELVGVTVAACWPEVARLAQDRGGVQPLVVDLLFAALGSAPGSAHGILRTRLLGSPDPLAPRGDPMTTPWRTQPPRNGGASASPAGAGPNTAQLDTIAPSLTRLAQEGKLPPLHGRVLEHRQVVAGMLGAMHNNVVILGDSGVGKTALARGLALEPETRLPSSLSYRQVRQLDLDALLAGFQRGGMLEEQTRPLFAALQQEGCILVIDDLQRVVVGASAPGGAAGLVPALRVLLESPAVPIVATCSEADWGRSVDRLPSFARQFQTVLIEEPTPAEAQGITRAVASFLSERHGLPILDEAVGAAVELGRRYLPRLKDPARAISLLDGACAAVLMARSVPPRELVTLDARILLLQREEEQLREELGQRVEDRAEEIVQEIARLRSRRLDIEEQWRQDRALDEELEGAGTDARRAGSRAGRLEASRRYDAILARRRSAVSVGRRVDSDAVASVVSDRTGVPAARVRLSEAQRLLHMEDELHEMIVGQDVPIAAVARAVRRSRAGLQQPRRPIAAFLFRGPSGVGKTETARALAKFLYNDPDAMVRIDMAEFAEKHNLARLTGSAPGLVGYDEGGVLTNAVLMRPSSVVLLDEVEKAHPDCMNLFLQVLDNGRLTDSKGRAVDFRQTVIVLTTNLPGDEAIRKWFRPEFLGRLDGIIEYDALTEEQLVAIARKHAEEILGRARDAHGIGVTLDEGTLEHVVRLVADPRYGARPIHRGITEHLVDPLTTTLLGSVLGPGSQLRVRLLTFEDGGEERKRIEVVVG